MNAPNMKTPEFSDLRAYLAQQEKKSLLRFLTCGSVDDGKSTLIGRLLYDSKLIFEDHLGVVEQPTNQRRLAVIHAAAGDKAQQVLVLVFVEVGLDIFGDQFRRMCHNTPIAGSWKLEAGRAPQPATDSFVGEPADKAGEHGGNLSCFLYPSATARLVDIADVDTDVDLCS